MLHRIKALKDPPGVVSQTLTLSCVPLSGPATVLTMELRERRQEHLGGICREFPVGQAVQYTGRLREAVGTVN